MRNNNIRTITYVALFTALTVIGTMIKIPLPTGGFVHLGNAVLLLAVLLLGYWRGALAGGLGFAIFDIMNGFAAEAPYFFVESFIVGGAAYLVILLFNRKITTIGQVVCVGIGAAVAKLAMTQLKNTAIGLMAGADLTVAFTAATTKLFATGINVCLSIVIVVILYFPLKKAIKM